MGEGAVELTRRLTGYDSWVPEAAERPLRGRLLDEAADLICGVQGDRNSLYGPPTVNHQRIADLWSTFLEVPVTSAQAALMLALVKIARLIESPHHHDSYVDAAGYVAIARECIGETPDD